MKVARYANLHLEDEYLDDDTAGLLDCKISIDLDLTEYKLKKKFMKSGDCKNM